MNQMELSAEGISALHDYRLRWNREIDEWLRYPIEDFVLPTELKNKKTIYIVQGTILHEFTEVIKVFADNNKAEEFVKHCNDYDKQTLLRKARETEHPAGREYDYYEVSEVELE